MAEVNHLIESGSKKIVGRHQNFLQFLSGFYGHYFNFSGISRGGFPAKTFCLSAFQGFCRADYVAKAEGIALPAGDKAAFTELLGQALAVKDAPGSPKMLANEVMRRRARWLLDNTDDLF